MNKLIGLFAEQVRQYRSCWPPLVVATTLRVGLLVITLARSGTRIMTQGDTSSYLEPGRSLFFRGAFATDGIAEIDRTPGYPIFAMLTGCLHGNEVMTALCQVIVSLISLLMVYKIANRVFPGSKAGLLAAWLYAFEPLSIVYSLRLMPETLFVMLLLISIERIVAYLQSGRLTVLAIAGMSLAAATFVRPVTYYLGFAIAIGLVVASGKRKGHWWKAPAILLLTFYPFLFAWQARNFLVSGYSGFSSIVEKNLYFFQSAEISAELRHISLAERQRELGYVDQNDYDIAHPGQTNWTRPQRLRYMRLESTQILSAHPALYLKTHFAGVGIVAFTPCATELLQLVGAYPSGDSMPRRVLNEGVGSSLLRVIELQPTVAMTMATLEGLLLVLYVFAVRGCIGRGRPSVAVVTLAGIAFYFLIISGGAQAVGRYRIPVMPELCILAAGGLSIFSTKKNAGPIRPRTLNIT